MKVLELFAGVGGFRVGLERADKNYFHTYWSNQYEPNKKRQDAFNVYQYHYPDSENLNIDISKITDAKFKQMDADMIVGGFPCQDYSVARSNNNALGIEGKKGVLFWQIVRAVNIIKPKYLLLENVDRLLKSPAKQRGRDFGIMLSSFNNLGYSVTWRVINAAEYNMPQRRKRTYIFIVRNDLIKIIEDYQDYLLNSGLFARVFKTNGQIVKNRISSGELDADLVSLSDMFIENFYNSGIMQNGHYYSIDTKAVSSNFTKTLGDICENEVSDEFYYNDSQIAKFKYLRGSKKIKRVTSSGHEYIYSEGAISPYDSFDLPSRTLLTSEGTVSRTTHFIKDEKGFRKLTPVECERLQTFDDNWTKIGVDNGEVYKISNRMRYFLMGNALVCDIVTKLAIEIAKLNNI